MTVYYCDLKTKSIRIMQDMLCVWGHFDNISNVLLWIMMLRFNERGQTLFWMWETLSHIPGRLSKGALVLWIPYICYLGSPISATLVEKDDSRTRVLLYAYSVEIVVAVAKLSLENINCSFLISKNESCDLGLS